MCRLLFCPDSSSHLRFERSSSSFRSLIIWSAVNDKSGGGPKNVESIARAILRVYIFLFFLMLTDRYPFKILGFGDRVPSLRSIFLFVSMV
ncbi:hypothetical protein NY2A_b062L [Paramecium bursaria Chlorella virus NY2A]|uniref:Uncharacterized protein b062L n=1 Tax=Paramecium bursaria Chlorella virus NY2A TaxID=46021 RepID=A7IVT7_PBCVN|nr:hypothetical protein NY2A_b062L [Paramecium bursaria Chlorella virus NY2A]ABT14461.1 hypothetical protein NY2A_b062L [Paramecium bursaria Chlorella virus NY2A]